MVEFKRKKIGYNEQYFVQVPTELVKIKVGDKWTECLVDTGTNISVLKASVVDNSLLSSAKAHVKLTAAFGDDIQAVLANVPLILSREDGSWSG